MFRFHELCYVVQKDSYLGKTSSHVTDGGSYGGVGAEFLESNDEATSDDCQGEMRTRCRLADQDQSSTWIPDFRSLDEQM